jgi:hypothetical protein
MFHYNGKPCQGEMLAYWAIRKLQRYFVVVNTAPRYLEKRKKKKKLKLAMHAFELSSLFGHSFRKKMCFEYGPRAHIHNT